MSPFNSSRLVRTGQEWQWKEDQGKEWNALEDLSVGNCVVAFKFPQSNMPMTFRLTIDDAGEKLDGAVTVAFVHKRPVNLTRAP